MSVMKESVEAVDRRKWEEVKAGRGEGEERKRERTRDKWSGKFE